MLFLDLWFADIFAMMLVYVVGFIAITLIAGVIAPKVARKFSGRFSLSASMFIIGLLTIGISLVGFAIIIYALSGFLGYYITAGFVASALLFILVLNSITYALSPFIINMAYGARPDPELQRLVDEVARSLGMSKPPKAVVVEGPANAFAYGNFLSGRYIAVSRELLSIMREDELRAVIGHEAGHHVHKDNALMLFMGMLPSALYFLGVTLMRVGFLTSARALSNRRSGGGGAALVLVGLVAVVLSFLVQVLVLAFSRLREYYADMAGALATSPISMQRALARLHIYYERYGRAKEAVSNSKLRALFIYAIVEAFANPFYRYPPRPSADVREADVDEVIETLKKKEVSGLEEILSTHPPIPKRLRNLEQAYAR